MKTLGAVLLGFGLALLLEKVLPLTWLWPLGFVITGVLFWQKLGSWGLRVSLLTMSLMLALFNGLDLISRSQLNEANLIASYRATAEQITAWTELEHLEIMNAVGQVTVEGDDALQLEASYFSQRGGVRAPEELQASYDPSTRTLTLIGLNPVWSQQQRKNLSAILDIQLPKHVTVSVHSGVGDISVKALTKAILFTGIGEIRAEGISEQLVAKNDMGNISLKNCQGKSELRSRVGSLMLEFNNPLNAPLSVTTDVGNISIVLPQASNVSIRAHSSLRKLSGDLAERLTASEARLRLGAGDHEVSLSTKLGEISVKQR